MSDNFKSISSASCAELIIKKSKFLSFVEPVASEEEVELFLKQLKKQYIDASHICYAYVLKNSKEKASDAGEPSGTAGVPMLNVLKKQGLKNVVVVVVRYFGGIKLGAGGLVRAYAKAVGAVIKKSSIVNYVKKSEYKLCLSYEESKIVKKLEDQNFIKVLKVDYNEKVEIELLVSKEAYAKLVDYLNNLLNKKVELIFVKDTYMGE